MEIAIIASLLSFLGVIVGGMITYLIQNKKFKHEFKLQDQQFIQDLNLQKQNLEQDYKLKFDEEKTLNIAERTINYYLTEDERYERSFNHIKTKLGGFEEEKLRRILVRAGAVRFIRDKSQEEYWCLVKRLPEKYKKDKEKNKNMRVQT